jgi:glutathione synthase/RimK-type ligase-like ATP-grasp enzyme
MILIVTGEDDVHADPVQAELERRGADVARFDPAWFPAEAELAVRVGNGGAVGGRLGFRGHEIELERIGAVWRRRPGQPQAAAELAGSSAGDAVEGEATAVLADLWELLDVRQLPASPDAIAHATHKTRQLLVAGQLGFELPATLVTNAPDAFLESYERRRGGMITKRARPSQRLAAADGETVVRYTEPVRPRDLVHVEDLRLCPLIVQHAVPKRLELRVTVVGSRVFAAAIHSQASHHTRLDWRRYDLVRTPIEPFPLPLEVEERCLALVRHLGLRFGAIDLVLTPDDQFVFLEINPNGQYLWIERATSLPISDAIADLLLADAA